MSGSPSDAEPPRLIAIRPRPISAAQAVAEVRAAAAAQGIAEATTAILSRSRRLNTALAESLDPYAQKVGRENLVRLGVKPPDKPSATKRLGLVPIATIPPERIDWAWKGRLAFGKLHDLSGDAGEGKSLMVTVLAAQVSRGLALPFGSEQVRAPLPVLYFAAEDDAADTLRPRFEVAGGDPSMLHVQHREADAPILPRDLALVREAVLDFKVGMIIFDPIFSYIGDLDSNSYTAAVSVCDPLRKLAAEARAIVVNIRHLNKGAGLAARYRSGGSVAWGAKPRVTLTLGRDPNDSEIRVLASVKGNLAAAPRASTFRVEEVPYDGWCRAAPGQGPEPVSRALWGPESNVTADTMLGAEHPRARGPTKIEQAAGYIRDRLRQAGADGLPWEPLLAEAQKITGARSRDTIYDARARLAGEVVDFKPNPDDPRDPLRLRLRDLPEEGA